MPVIHHSAIVPHSAAEMFELVNRVEDYPQFLPWCKASQVLSRTEDECRAMLVLHRGGIEKSFTTCNRLQKDKMIEIRLLDGPFRQLEGFWRFDPLEEKSCKITLDLEFEFASRLVGFAVGPIFQQAVSTLVDAFRDRAKVVYGE